MLYEDFKLSILKNMLVYYWADLLVDNYQALVRESIFLFCVMDINSSLTINGFLFLIDLNPWFFLEQLFYGNFPMDTLQVLDYSY